MASKPCSRCGATPHRLAGRGLCPICYNRDWRAARRSGPTQLELPIGVHFLTDVDRSIHRACCAVCGPNAKVSVKASGRVTCRGTEKRPGRRSTAQKRAGRYGITPEFVPALLIEQGGICRICEDSITEADLHVDHDHATGRIRGLLCRTCNIGLGYFRDDPVKLGRAISYLQG